MARWAVLAALAVAGPMDVRRRAWVGLRKYTPPEFHLVSEAFWSREEFASIRSVPCTFFARPEGLAQNLKVVEKSF